MVVEAYVYSQSSDGRVHGLLTFAKDEASLKRG